MKKVIITNYTTNLQRLEAFLYDIKCHTWIYSFLSSLIYGFVENFVIKSLKGPF
ncbi:hypothetical protein [Pseudotamlana carrageenivorans]|uniref:hypothetical protein n=1 Tax=Pseudotamlana carrageenivorans TaxID=2069432 RepID=UPI001315690A|nr:hypothetical protein [Tamlana carrageenivorans]